jgi:cytochrome P450
MTEASDADLLDLIQGIGTEERRLDPYPYYHQVRRQHRLHQAGGRWLVTGYREAAAILDDRCWQRLAERQCLPDRAVCPVSPEVSDFVFEAGPARERIRDAFLDAYGPRRLRTLRPRLERVADDLLAHAAAAARDNGSVDFVAEIAYPMSVIGSCDLLGLPTSDLPRLKRWSDALIRGTDPLFSMSPQDMSDRDEASRESMTYFTELLARRRAEPGDDYLSALMADSVGERAMSDREMAALAVMLMVAPQEMTTNFLSLATYTLFRNPDQMARLRAQPVIAKSAVEELLRYDSPSQIVPRYATEDVEVDGTPIRRGEIAVVMIGAANRDPEGFPEPDVLDLTRAGNPHLTFASGEYYCPGAALSRLVGRIVLTRVACHVPNLGLHDEPARQNTFCIRGLDTLPVTFG